MCIRVKNHWGCLLDLLPPMSDVTVPARHDPLLSPGVLSPSPASRSRPGSMEEMAYKSIRTWISSRLTPSQVRNGVRQSYVAEGFLPGRLNSDGKGRGELQNLAPPSGRLPEICNLQIRLESLPPSPPLFHCSPTLLPAQGFVISEVFLRVTNTLFN